MALSLLLKLCLGLVGEAGVGSIIGVPVALHSSGRLGGTNNSRQGEGSSLVSVNLEKCSDLENFSINKTNLGEKEGTFCWKAEEWIDNLGLSGEYTKLFKDEWGQGSRVWGSGISDNWKSACRDTQSNWQIWGSGNGEQHLGLCGKKKVEETPFVKKKSEGGSANIWICSSGCWKNVPSEIITQGQISLTQEESNGWKKVEFFKTN